MNQTHERSTAIDDGDYSGARAHEIRMPGRFAAWFAVFLAIAIGMSAWAAVSTGVTGASAAGADAQTTPHMPYLPSSYVNQATTVESVPAKF